MFTTDEDRTVGCCGWRKAVFTQRVLCQQLVRRAGTHDIGVAGLVEKIELISAGNRGGGEFPTLALLVDALACLRSITGKHALTRMQIKEFANDQRRSDIRTAILVDQRDVRFTHIASPSRTHRQDRAVLSAIGEDIFERPFITIGFTAFLILIVLAATSTNGMRRRMGKRWQKLHYGVYDAGVLGVWHYWWQVKLDVSDPAIYAALLVVLLGYRLWHRKRKVQAS